MSTKTDENPPQEPAPNEPVNSPSEPLLALRAISKEFPGCLANDQVDFAVYPGKIHALLGENGAGKSTLVNIIYGVLQASSGTIYWQGQPVRIDSPAVARSMGIAMVFQHFSLFESLTVLENIALSLDTNHQDKLQGDSLSTSILEVSERYGLPLEPERYVYTLSVGERQRIEIIRCLLQQPKVLIMDEPTSVLTPQEVERLFATLRRLAQEGVAIIYISHKLQEIKQLCDEATILRHGKKVASADPAQESARSLAGMMIGETLTASVRPVDVDFGEVLLEASNLKATTQVELSTAIQIQGLDFRLRAGEILGVAGVAGNGQDELMGLLAGEIAASSSQMLKLEDRPIGQIDAGKRRSLGICCVPEERLGHAAVPEMTLAENAFLTAHHRLDFRTRGFIRESPVAEFARQIIDRFQVACRNENSLAKSLSGGNLQKFVVGREILQQPKVLIVAQPTWGVDAGAAAAIHEALVTLASKGSAILIVSQDLDELMTLCHSIFALCAGAGSKTYRSSELNVQQIGLLMAGMSVNEAAQ